MIESWTAANLQALIGQAESSNLEFKASAALVNTQAAKRELAKDVSAMANAAGGVIVYGIVETDGAAERLDDGVDPGVSQEWIDQVLTSNIEPKIAGLIIKRFPVENGRSLYALEVPQATVFAPHMSKPHHQYWTRRNTTTEPLLDHEVRDLMRRASSPHIMLAMSLKHMPQAMKPNTFLLSIIAKNLSPEPVLYWAIDLTFDKLLAPEMIAPHLCREVMISDYGGEHAALMHSKNYGVPVTMPLFAEREFEVIKTPITMLQNHRYPWAYNVACPGFKAERFGEFRRGERGQCEVAIFENGLPS